MSYHDLEPITLHAGSVCSTENSTPTNPLVGTIYTMQTRIKLLTNLLEYLVPPRLASPRLDRTNHSLILPLLFLSARFTEFLIIDSYKGVSSRYAILLVPLPEATRHKNATPLVHPIGLKHRGVSALHIP